jgi:peroxiredoxin
VRSDIAPGGTFPDHALPDHTGTVRSLGELQGDDPMVLTLARGHYCPKEHQQHLELAAFQPKLAVAYTQIVTISTDVHHTLQEFRASVGAQWPFPSDHGRTIQKDLRPDWDLSRPGLGEAWDSGDYSFFHGWDRQTDKPPKAP